MEKLARVIKLLVMVLFFWAGYKSVITLWFPHSIWIVVSAVVLMSAVTASLIPGLRRTWTAWPAGIASLVYLTASFASVFFPFAPSKITITVFASAFAIFLGTIAAALVAKWSSDKFGIWLKKKLIWKDLDLTLPGSEATIIHVQERRSLKSFSIYYFTVAAIVIMMPYIQYVINPEYSEPVRLQLSRIMHLSPNEIASPMPYRWTAGYPYLIFAIMIGIQHWRAGSSLTRRLRDKSRFCVYLRSFENETTDILDSVLVGFSGRFLGALLRYTSKIKIGSEPALISHINSMKNTVVLAVGKPEEELPPLGAVRFYIRQLEWRPIVAQLLDAASYIVVAIGTSAGLAWEIESIINKKHLGKVILAFPSKERITLYDHFREKFGSLFPIALPLHWPKRESFLTFDVDGVPRFGLSEQMRSALIYKTRLGAAILVGFGVGFAIILLVVLASLLYAGLALKVEGP